jgi:hypothetical protein
VIPVERIANQIYLIRGEKVMLDSDLAELYAVPTSALNQQVTRNLDRFPDDFAFRITAEEFDSLMSQTVISNDGRGGRRKLPMVFTEQGAAMLSSDLRSKRASGERRDHANLRQTAGDSRDTPRRRPEGQGT